jgi:multidrug transporter EmrE-like cation transporter
VRKPIWSHLFFLSTLSSWLLISSLVLKVKTGTQYPPIWETLGILYFVT